MLRNSRCDFMHGWRGRIGLIVPSINTTMEPELYELAPEGVAIYATRVVSSRSQPIERLLDYESSLESASDALAAICDVIIYGCTTGSLVKGLGYDQKIIQRIEKRSRLPASTTSTAVVEALREMNMTKLAVATPYLQELDVLVKKFLEDHGFEVVNLKSLGQISGLKGIGANVPEVSYRLAREVCDKRADGVFISCTNLRTIEVISKLEQDIGKPVISSNQASMWKALKLIGVREPIKGYGLLLGDKLN